MSKRTLNLSVEESIKERAKRIARKRGISVSQFFEELITNLEESDSFTPSKGTAAYELTQLIPESEKVDEYHYEKLKEEAMKDKYDHG